jgi:hypothetical protein
MATVLKSYDWQKISRSNKRSRSRSYPWGEWFDGRIWQLEQGTDFDGPPASLERVIRTSANRRKIKVRIRIDGEQVILQQHGGEMPTVSKSPSLKSIKAARTPETPETPETNGDGAKATKATKRRSSRKPDTANTPGKRTVRRVKAATPA